MIKTKLFLIVALIASPVLFTGCGGSSETNVVEKADDPSASGLSADDEAGYEAAMEKQRGGN
jgi:hypothetical protein